MPETFFSLMNCRAQRKYQLKYVATCVFGTIVYFIVSHFWTGGGKPNIAHILYADTNNAAAKRAVDGDETMFPRESSTTGDISKSDDAANPSWSCHVVDQLSYCVYYRSLCFDENAGLVLLTSDPNKQGLPVSMLNHLSPGPWHAPGIEMFYDTSYGRYDIPFRSFFASARYSSPKSFEGFLERRGWSLVAAFDADNYNIYHYMNKLQAAFIARLYELAGLRDRSTLNTVDLLHSLRSSVSEFDYAYLFRPPPTSWQQNYGELCLGNKTKFIYAPQDSAEAHHLPFCFERAIIPGAALYLADGLISSILFRELAAEMKGIRVADPERNLITIFDRRNNRRITNLHDLISAVKNLAPGLQVVSVDWDGDTDFTTQAMHMARTRIMICTHGSVLNHNAFMETAGVVIEVNAYQFIYPLDNQIVLSRGNYYIRYEESLANSKHQGLPFGHDPFPGISARQCMMDMGCLISRRDADVRVNLSNFIGSFKQALSLIT